jgi:uncharacterized membrane protein YbhN (UPF0104 family)
LNDLSSNPAIRKQTLADTSYSVPSPAEPEAQRPAVRRSAFWRALRLAVGLILLVLIFQLVDWPTFFNLLRTALPGYVALALSVNFVDLALSAWRWQILLKSEGLSVPLLRLARYYLVSLFFNNYLPPFVGADAVRMLSLKESKSPGVRVVSVLIERGSGLFALCLFGGVAILANPELRQYSALDALVLVALIGVAGAFAALLFPETWLWAVGLSKRIPRLYDILLDIASAGKRYRQKRTTLAATFLISALIQVTVMVAYQFRALTFGVDVSLWKMLLVVPAITMLSMLPISPGGIGTREGFFALAFGLVGIDSTTALAMALLARALDIVMGVCGAIVWLRDR